MVYNDVNLNYLINQVVPGKIKSAKPPATDRFGAKINQDLTLFEQACRSIFRAIPDGILLVNAQTGSIGEFNPSLLKILGLAKPELLKRKVWQIGFLDGPLTSRAAFGRLNRGKPTNYEHLRVRAGRGQHRCVDLACVSYRAGGQGFIQFNLRDVTERWRLQTALWESAEQYRQIFDNSQLGIAIIALDLRVSKINPTFSRITGYGETDLKRLTLANITHPSHLSADRKILRAVRSCMAGDYHLETRYIGKQGNVIWANTHLGAVCDQDGKPLYFQAIAEDITERKQIEAELAEQNIRNLAKEKTIQRLKDEFIFIAAHELRTPVTAINWALEMLQESHDKGAADEEGLTKAAGLLGESAKRLNNLVAELLEVARLEYGTYKVIPEKFELEAVIERAVASVRQLADERSVNVTAVSAPSGSPAAFGDPSRVHEVMMNLLTNAIRYNHAGGSVTVRLREGREELLVSVEDTGVGLSPEDIPKLFCKFSRIENDEIRKVTGTGLGLFIVKQVVERMGGRVWAVSDGRGQGSTFTFCLPKAKRRGGGRGKGEVG